MLSLPWDNVLEIRVGRWRRGSEGTGLGREQRPSCEVSEVSVVFADEKMVIG